MNKKRIAWGITGAGHALDECIKTLLKYENVDVFLSRAAEEVVGVYGLDVFLNTPRLRVYRENRASSPLVGRLFAGMYRLLVVAPATSNSIAKFIHGISDTLVTNLLAQAGKARVPIVVFPTDLAPETAQVRGDSVSLQMLISNLVSNAVKYNKPGGSVKVRTHKDGSWIKLEVSDTGLGLSPDVRSHLFEEFYRAKTPETQNIPGTGLGLVICKRIVDELGGSIDVDSKKDEYTVFTVRLPAAELNSMTETAEKVGT